MTAVLPPCSWKAERWNVSCQKSMKAGSRFGRSFRPPAKESGKLKKKPESTGRFWSGSINLPRRARMTFPGCS